MTKPKRAYSNAGMQTQQGLRDVLSYGTAHPSALFPLKTISVILGIRLQKLVLIPVQRIMVDKRAYYRKGDIQEWIKDEDGKSDGLLAQLREEYAKTKARLKQHPSRRYVSGQISKEEAKEAKARTRVNREKPLEEAEVGIFERRAIISRRGSKTQKFAEDALRKYWRLKREEAEEKVSGKSPTKPKKE
jgi:hypothetical protein